MNTPSPRVGHTGVWTGSELIVWGGTGNGSYLNDGGRFNPALNSWIYLPGTASNVPPAREYHTAVWTGAGMIVWGGVNNGGFLNDGGLFNPGSGDWTYLAGTNANVPGARDDHTAVWTGTQMIIWGGAGNGGVLNDGGMFDPVANAWTTPPSGPARRWWFGVERVTPSPMPTVAVSIRP
jgi:hypothetical protein